MATKISGLKSPIFEPIMAPVLTSLVPKDVTEFLTAREQYLRRIDERRNTHKERVLPTSLLLSIEPKLLRMICHLRIRDVSADEVTGDHLERYLNKILKPKEILYDVGEVFTKELTFDMSVNDPDARLMKFFMDFDEIVKKHVMGEIFDDGDGRKLKSKILVKALRPEAVREMVKSTLKYNHRGARMDDQKLFDVLLRIVSNQDEIHRAITAIAGRKKTCLTGKNDRLPSSGCL